ncbi:FliC/FljB family flagellin [Halomonas chromatireducens]|uniref:Flagellin n=1 Tax=Halomonas chromatireducens TaxID=507626 RepID=A0A0X8HFV0_9GAMM|nr:FliC/FljB family flagellin [Halomonas chromatireducens]AMD01844.1 Flagellin 2 [Halomonas chromatireducens]
MSVINTNITSMIGQSNLNKSQNALQTSMERLSSGLRINSAKDDAAGQAIANRMTSQITGLNQAQRNANDGISVAQTAEGSLNQINDNLQRIRELTVQAANGTNSADDLQSIQDEINQRLDEINRISDETSFNGVNVLKEDNALKIQVGANDGETITVNLQQINSETLGLEGFSVKQASLNVSSPISVFDDGTGAEAIDFEVIADNLSVALGGAAGDIDASEVKLRSVLDDAGDATGNYVVEYNGEYYAADVTAADDIDIETVEVDGEDYAVKVSNNADGDPTGYISTEVGNLEVGEFGAFAAVATWDLDDAETYEDDIFSGAATANPLAALDSALNKVDSLRSELGAVQNRFEDAITNLNTNSTNLSAARSRIEDADYAEEVANMTRAQILQQAGTSVLAQANQIPQNVLSLLG